METNSIITGPINGSCNGIHRTYEDSIITSISINDLNYIYKNFNKTVLFLNKEKGSIFVLTDDENNNITYEKCKDKLVPLEILNISIIESHAYSFISDDRWNNSYVVEVIERSLLHQHLVDERLRLTELGESYGRK